MDKNRSFGCESTTIEVHQCSGSHCISSYATKKWLQALMSYWKPSCCSMQDATTTSVLFCFFSLSSSKAKNQDKSSNSMTDLALACLK